MTTIRACVVGVGLRGLSLVERLCAAARLPASSHCTFSLDLVDPGFTDSGPFAVDQPDYLLLNIVCGQVSLFPDDSSVNFAPPHVGPSLHSWASQRGLRIASDGFTVSDTGRPIQPGDFLPRRLLGEYMRWFLMDVLRRAPANVSVSHYRQSAIAINVSKGARIVQLRDGNMLHADYVFLCVGQALGASDGTTHGPVVQDIVAPYPLPDSTRDVAAGEVVAIAGLGLTAIDAIMALTVGRGGNFQAISGVHSYIPSGSEPRLIAYSRSGIPYRSRPSVAETSSYYPAVVFTPTAMWSLRGRLGTLDFDRDVLPILFTEMRIAYHRAMLFCNEGVEAADTLIRILHGVASEETLDCYLRGLDRRQGAYDPASAYAGTLLPELSGPPNEDGYQMPPYEPRGFWKDSNAYEQAFLRRVRADLEMAHLGVPRSPFKAALEICRDFRDAIRAAVDFGGLASQSHEHFFAYHGPTINRLVVGPQKERAADIVALVDAGILRVPLGPAPDLSWDNVNCAWRLRSRCLRSPADEYADWHYRARSVVPGCTERDQGLIADLYRKGNIRRYRPKSSYVLGIDVDTRLHPLNMRGQADERLWVLGLLCEGVTFYNNYVPSPGKYVRAFDDADKAVGEMIRHAFAGTSSVSSRQLGSALHRNEGH